MINRLQQIYQFKITICESEPEIWRRILIPEEYNFLEFHIAIQDAMGWEDAHMHDFKIFDPKTKKSIFIVQNFDDDHMSDNDIKNIAEEKVFIKDYFSVKDKKKCIYTYDFGDNWEHEIKLEKILPAEHNVKYPICIDGERACPPEDCGGIWGYTELLEIISHPKHESYTEMMEWLGEPFDPEKFNCKKIKFSHSKHSLKNTN